MNQATVAVAGDAGALFRNTVNLEFAGSGTAAFTATPPATFCIRARTRLDALRWDIGTTADFDPEGMTTVPPRSNLDLPLTRRPSSPEVLSALTPVPEPVQRPCTPQIGPDPTTPSLLRLPARGWPVCHRARARRARHRLPALLALPPPDLREGREVPPDTEAVARHAAPCGDRPRSAGPARLVPGLLQQQAPPPGGGSTDASGGVRSQA